MKKYFCVDFLHAYSKLAACQPEGWLPYLRSRSLFSSLKGGTSFLSDPSRTCSEARLGVSDLFETGGKFRAVKAKLSIFMDTLGFEPRAFRMRSGCDTTTPCAR